MTRNCYLVTRLNALVNSALQRSVAGHAARNLGNVTRDVTAQLVSAMTPFLSEQRTWRTLLFSMARMLRLQTSINQI